jgi:hypothetical protein
LSSPEAFVDDRALLIEDHPGHDHRSHIGRQQHSEARLADRDASSPVDNRGRMDVQHKQRRHEQELQQADGNRDTLDPAVAPTENERYDRGGSHPYAGPASDPEHRADAGDSRELGDQRPETNDEQRRYRDGCPSWAAVLADERAVALARDHPESHRYLLDGIESWDQKQQGQDLCKTPLGPRLGSRDDAPGISVCQHY